MELQVPKHYVFIHFVTGFIAASYPIIGIFALIYQLAQYYYGVRVFPIEGKVIQGNSPRVTSNKILQIGIGYLIGSLYQLRTKRR
jgi:hypothetical protein